MRVASLKLYGNFDVCIRFAVASLTGNCKTNDFHVFCYFLSGKRFRVRRKSEILQQEFFWVVNSYAFVRHACAVGDGK